MGIFSGVMTSQVGLHCMSQSLFNALIFNQYVLRARYETFDEYWHANTEHPDRPTEKISQFFSACSLQFPGDTLLLGQLSEASLELEKYWLNRYGIGEISFDLFKIVLQLTSQYSPQGELKNKDINTIESVQPQTQLRVLQCLDDLRCYEDLVGTKKLFMVTKKNKIDCFAGDLYEGMVSQFHYSGSLLKVYEEDAFLVGQDLIWCRWSLHHNQTGFTDIWLVTIEDNRAQVQKMVKQTSEDTYNLEDTQRWVEMDEEMKLAIAKTQDCAIENANNFCATPPYVQMLNLLQRAG